MVRRATAGSNGVRRCRPIHLTDHFPTPRDHDPSRPEQQIARRIAFQLTCTNSPSAAHECDLGGTGNWGEAAILSASDAQADDDFGASVAADGDIVVVGDSRADNAPGCGAPCNSSGAVRFYQRDAGGTDNFAEILMLTATDASAGDRFGQSVALAGETLVVGSENIDDAPACNGDCEDTGAVYVFCVDLYPAVPGSIFQDGFEVSAAGQCTVL